MPDQPPHVDLVRPCAAEWNDRIRALSWYHRDEWTAEALVELARLRAGWQAAVAWEAELAA
jgi:hypothetical protein